MKKINKGKTDLNLSVSNLPEEYTIKDTQSYITYFRKNYLKSVRESLGYTIDDVQLKIKISKEELIGIEAGKVNSQHMMILHQLADLYDINYSNLLFLLKLAKKQPREATLKMAACHDQKTDAKTLEMLSKFLEKLKDI